MGFLHCRIALANSYPKNPPSWNQYDNDYMLQSTWNEYDNNRWHANKQYGGLYMDEPDSVGHRQNNWQPPYMYDDNNNYLHEFYNDQSQTVNQMNRQLNHHHHNSNYGPNYNSYRGNFRQLPQNEPDYGGVEGYSEDKPIQATVFSHHEQKVYKIPDEYHYHRPTVVQLEGKIYPVELHFNSYSSPLITKHMHHPIEHVNEDTYSRDEPNIHTHTISKNLVHEIRFAI